MVAAFTPSSHASVVIPTTGDDGWYDTRMDEKQGTATDAENAADDPKAGALDLSNDADLAGAVEAILLTSDKPLGTNAIANALMPDDPKDAAQRIDDAITALNEIYGQTGRAFRIRPVAGGYRLMTEPRFAPALLALQGARQSGKLSRPALETLAIIAYRQPVTRATIESIRGVSAGDVIKSLLERRLIDIVGRAEELGRPMLYGTSKHFLEVFGLRSTKDLPAVGDIPSMPGAQDTRAATKPTPGANAPPSETSEQTRDDPTPNHAQAHTEQS